MRKQAQMVELKKLVDTGMSAQGAIESGVFEGVYQTQVLSVGNNSITYAPMLRFGEDVQLSAGDELTFMFFVGDVCYRYSGRVRSVDAIGTGSIEVLDGSSAEILNQRKKLRIPADIDCTCTCLSSGRSWLGRIMDIDVQGVGLVLAEQPKAGSKVQIVFSLPRTVHNDLTVQAKVRHTRPIMVGGKSKVRCGLDFLKISRAASKAIYQWIINELECTSKTQIQQRTCEPSCQHLMAAAKTLQVETMWDRSDIMQPQCAFGELGICCHNCLQGPCRVDPFGEGAQQGICGASADTMVAKNLVRMIAAGTSSHAEHGRHLLHVLQQLNEQENLLPKVQDQQHLVNTANRFGYTGYAANLREALETIIRAVHESYYNPNPNKQLAWLEDLLPVQRCQVLREANLLPADVFSTVVDLLHRTHIGVDSNPKSLLRAGLRCAVADFASLSMATQMADVLFGSPKPHKTLANLAVLREDAVNIALHGHNAVISEAICNAAKEMEAEAIANKAPGGINIVGICCTGNELTMRHGIPLASNFASQELAIASGAVDAMIVDYQCIAPGIVKAAECFHTQIITCLPMARLPESRSVQHIELGHDDQQTQLRSIVRTAIEAYSRRDAKKVSIPEGPQETWVGFSPQAILDAFGCLDNQSALEALVRFIRLGDIQGVALLAGCNNVLLRQDHSIVNVATQLIEKDVLVLATGCSAGALAKSGLMSPEATDRLAGPGLSSVLSEVGHAARLGCSLPPALHMGSCVDNSRAVDLAIQIAKHMSIDLQQMPLVVSVPEAMSEKAVAISSSAVALGLVVHLGVQLPINGSPQVVEFLTHDVRQELGGAFLFESNPVKAAQKMIKIIQSRRQSLGL